MPYYNLKEVWTPLRYAGISFYRDQDLNVTFVKVWNRRKRKINR